MISRRLRNESIRIQEREDLLGDEINYFLTTQTDNEFYFVLFIEETKIYNIKMVFPNSYPFHVPKIIVITEYGDEIGDYLLSLRAIKIFNEQNQPRCLCCESVVCHGKWHATLNIINIMDEINKNYHTSRNNVLDSCCNSIIRQRMKRNAHPFLEYKLIQQFLY